MERRSATSRLPINKHEFLVGLRFSLSVQVGNDGNEWNAVKNECVKRWKECPSDTFGSSHCQRGGAHVFYSIGGVVCNSPKLNNKCTFEKVIYASFFHRSKSAIDSKGISHAADPEHWTRWNVLYDFWAGFALDYTVQFVPTRDSIGIYFGTHMGRFEKLPSGNPQEKDSCATLNFEIDGDGQYEISIKYADYKYNNISVDTTKYKRAFNVILNDMYIAREFNPNDYRPIRHGMELNANFRVFENGKMLELQGHPSRAIVGQKLKLEMCYSFCARTGYKADPNWMMTAVSIVKFASKPDDPCDCKIKYSNKEYHTVYNQCIDDLEFGGCSSLHFTRQNKFCQRKGDHIFYSIYGTVCNSKIENNFCVRYGSLYAVNFGGNTHFGERSILYDKVNLSDWQFKPNVWRESTTKKDVKGVPQKDVELYKTYLSGDPFFGNGTRSVEIGCAVLLFSTGGSGNYEISMKTGEIYWDAALQKNRTFSVLLNDMYIVKEFVVERYRKSPNGVELVANFRLFNNSEMLELQGHPPIKVERSDKKLQFEICHSTCEEKKLGFSLFRNWIMYGLSIVKFSV